MPRPKLKKGDVTIEDVLNLTRYAFRRKIVDNKEKRSKLDVVSGRIIARKNLKYNASTRTWEQTGRETRIDFLVRTKPVSYKKTDNIAIHKYPVTFLIRDVSMGIKSPFRWRTGSLKRPKFTKKGMTKTQRQKIIESNIKNGVQLEFFFDLEFVLNKWGLLFGPNYTNGTPRKTNPDMIPFFDKHALFCCTRILINLLTKGKLSPRAKQ